MLQEGDKTPDFSASTDGARTLTLSALRGALVELYFYPKDDTSGCTKEALAFSGLANLFSVAGCQIVGISPDSVASHNKFKDKHSLTIALAADEDKEIAKAYGVWVEKSMYGNKYIGVERATFLLGSRGHIGQIWRKVRIPGHAEAVLKSVNGVQ